MRKLINDPANFVDEVIDGILTAHPGSLRSASGVCWVKRQRVARVLADP
jgi:dihydroxyacetone kinase